MDVGWGKDGEVWGEGEGEVWVGPGYVCGLGPDVEWE